MAKTKASCHEGGDAKETEHRPKKLDEKKAKGSKAAEGETKSARKDGSENTSTKMTVDKPEKPKTESTKKLKKEAITDDKKQKDAEKKKHTPREATAAPAEELKQEKKKTTSKAGGDDEKKKRQRQDHRQMQSRKHRQ